MGSTYTASAYAHLEPESMNYTFIEDPEKNSQAQQITDKSIPITTFRAIKGYPHETTTIPRITLTFRPHRSLQIKHGSSSPPSANGRCSASAIAAIATKHPQLSIGGHIKSTAATPFLHKRHRSQSILLRMTEQQQQ